MELLIGLFGHFIIAVIHMVVIALDITAFFLIMRLLAIKWPILLFETFDRIGASLIDPLQGAARRAGVSHRASYLAISLVLASFRLALVATASSIIAGT
jgi:hypothetical protein